MPHSHTTKHSPATAPSISITHAPLKQRHAFAALGLGVLLACAAPALQAAELDYIAIGPMYMAYFDRDTGSSQLVWRNAGDYASEGPQVLRPLSLTHPGDYYASTVPGAALLNPHSNGGLDAASSRLFGFSLTGDLRNYLLTNSYAFAIRLDSIVFAGTETAADNASVFYYNRGNDDMSPDYFSEKVEWSQLTADNHLIWNGQGFHNMIHPLVVSTDDFPAYYTLTYTVSLVSDITGENVNATVADLVTPVAGIPPLTFSYTVESLGATPVPEPATYALLLGGAVLALAAIARRAKANAVAA